ncbi:MAG TPA: glycosyltransferase [Candidatus Methylacidiphilales bacterium]
MISNVPEGVLVLSNDFLTPFAKTSEYLAAALERRRIPAYVRDNAEARMLTFLFSQEMKSKIPLAQEAVCDAPRELIEYAAIDTILSLDLNWYVTPGLFVDDPAIRSIHSLWFDDFRSWCTSPLNPCFPTEGDVFQQHVKHPKVMHHFYGDSQALEARLLGVNRQRITRLAAPRHLVQNEAPCLRTDRLAFIGNPGFRGVPHEEAVKLMESGAEIEELRSFCRDAILKYPDVHAVTWFEEEPSVRNLLAVALETRRRLPFQPALQIIQMAGTHYPRAFEYINEKGVVLDLAFLVKLVNRYDRPAFVHRLWKRGWIDVYSAVDEWKPYGIDALPYISFGQLPAHYRMYAAHLNAPNAIRDATANEKLFEIAASGRLSINLDSPDVRSCYDPGEITLVNSLAGLEAAAEQALRDPDAALASGEMARRRTTREHLWDHRIAAMFPNSPVKPG